MQAGGLCTIANHERNSVIDLSIGTGCTHCQEEGMMP
nr:MAG TPA: Hantavirus glycoprotein G2 [Caudoviricetes sp.]